MTHREETHRQETDRQDLARGRELVARWCNLAERRLEYLTELFETGRWRRFHSEVDFLQNIREAKAAVETWRDLLTREATRDNIAIDLSWLGRARATPRSAPPRDRPLAVSSPPARLAPEAPPAFRRPAAPPPVPVSLSAPALDAPSVEPEISPAYDFDLNPILDTTREASLDLAVMQARYPLLRNEL